MKNHKILIAMDSFKGSATSQQVGTWVKTGISNFVPKAEVEVLPIADGGEGTVQSLVHARNGTIHKQLVTDPLGKKVEAEFGMLDEHTAVIEVAEAIGLSLTSQSEAVALQASTYGVGELILAAIDQGAKTLYIGLGGSATTDGGAGMAQALGIQLIDKNDLPIQAGAIGLRDLAHIRMNTLDTRINEVEIKILSDVTNPLVGEYGAAQIYGRQKGIPQNRLEEVDHWLLHYSEVIKEDLAVDVRTIAGGGAAGGLGAALLAFTNATMTNGINEILSLIQFEEKLNQTTLVITGEGRMDNQSIHGKAPVGIAQLAKKRNFPVIAIVASCDNDLSQVYQSGIDLVISIIDQPMTLNEAIAQTKENTIKAGETAMRAFLLH
jgi:glycerate kinase